MRPPCSPLALSSSIAGVRRDADFAHPRHPEYQYVDGQGTHGPLMEDVTGPMKFVRPELLPDELIWFGWVF